MRVAGSVLDRFQAAGVDQKRDEQGKPNVQRDQIQGNPKGGAPHVCRVRVRGKQLFIVGKPNPGGILHQVVIGKPQIKDGSEYRDADKHQEYHQKRQHKQPAGEMVSHQVF